MSMLNVCPPQRVIASFSSFTFHMALCLGCSNNTTPPPFVNSSRQLINGMICFIVHSSLSRSISAHFSSSFLENCINLDQTVHGSEIHITFTFPSLTTFLSFSLIHFLLMCVPSPAKSPTGLSHITFLFLQARVRPAPPFSSSAQYSSKNDPLSCTCSTDPLFLFAFPSVVIILFTFVIFFFFPNSSLLLYISQSSCISTSSLSSFPFSLSSSSLTLASSSFSPPLL